MLYTSSTEGPLGVWRADSPPPVAGAAGRLSCGKKESCNQINGIQRHSSEFIAEPEKGSICRISCVARLDLFELFGRPWETRDLREDNPQ